MVQEVVSHCHSLSSLLEGTGPQSTEVGGCCCYVSGPSLRKAQVPAKALEYFCHLSALYLPGTKLRRWLEPNCFRRTSVTVLSIYLFLCSFSFSKIICLRKQVTFIVQGVEQS